jgi:hypothetical protein
MYRRMCGIALLLLLGSCGQNGTGGDPAITSVAIDAPPATLSPSQDVVLHATVQGTGAFNNAVTWSVEGGGTFADAGANPATFTAPAVTTETVVSVTVTSVADPTKSHSAQIAVTPGDLGPLQPRVEPSLEPADPTIPDQGGTTQPVARSEDATGVQSDFVAGVVLVRPASQEQLDAFLARYEGVVLSNDTVPEPPPQLGITLTDEQRRPVEYRVRLRRRCCVRGRRGALELLVAGWPAHPGRCGRRGCGRIRCVPRFHQPAATGVSYHAPAHE